MTATTGALADNHDVISLKTYSDLAVLEAEEEEERVSLFYDSVRCCPQT
jgi:hypothetical protein